MPQSPFPQPAPGFDDPIGLLRACHMRMLKHCATLQRLPEQGESPEMRSAVEKIRQYFNIAAPLHHQDEESDLFPLLIRRHAGLKEVVDELNSEHLELERAWRSLDQLLAAPMDPDNPGDLHRAIETFTTIYRQHIQREEQDLYMLADTVLSSDDLKQLGRAMAGRRDVDEEMLPQGLREK